MKSKILERAEKDIPLYFGDFKTFWDTSLVEINKDDLYIIYRTTLMYKNWKIALNSLHISEFDILINELYEDINSSLFLSLFGQYRSAYMHLRSSIELSLILLYFIHHPIEYTKWKEGDFVIKQDKLVSYLSSHPYFKEDIQGLLDQITKRWRHFSKHIHGESPSFFQCDRESKKTNTFDKADFGKWKIAFVGNMNSLNKLFLLFFKKDINRIPQACRDILLSTLQSEELEALLKN